MLNKLIGTILIGIFYIICSSLVWFIFSTGDTQETIQMMFFGITGLLLGIFITKETYGE